MHLVFLLQHERGCIDLAWHLQTIIFVTHVRRVVAKPVVMLYCVRNSSDDRFDHDDCHALGDLDWLASPLANIFLLWSAARPCKGFFLHVIRTTVWHQSQEVKLLRLLFLLLLASFARLARPLDAQERRTG